MKLIRFGVSMEEGLLSDFDRAIEEKGYANRSEALRDLVRTCLVEKKQEDPAAHAVGVISFIYDHERRELARKLIHLGHSHVAETISSMHVHLNRLHCLEIVVARGTVKQIQKLADQILSNRGVLHGELKLAPIPDQV